MKRVHSFVLFLFTTTFCFSQTIFENTVRPSSTDSNIGALPGNNDGNLSHYFYSGVDTMHTLVVFLHGTYRSPANYTYIMREIAKMGYHVIGLNYPYNPAVNPICKETGDVTCHDRARREVIDGIDRHTQINVDADNSILNRLSKLLQYLSITYPARNWDQFDVNGEIKWENIIVSGHSQGASLAAMIGLDYPVKRVVMWSVMDFLNNGSVPNWVDNSQKKDKLYAWIHPKDEQIPFEKALIGWEKLGMMENGMVNVACALSPYSDSHILYSTLTPPSPLGDRYHNVIIDTYLNTSPEYQTQITEVLKYFFRR